MQTIRLLFKVLWSPAESMFLLSKKPRVLVPMLFLCAFSFVAGTVMVMKVDMAELTIRALERSPQGATLSDQQKDLMRQQMNSPVLKSFTFVSTAIGPLLIVFCVTAIYFVLFTIAGREGGFKSFLSITTFAFIPLAVRQAAGVFSVFLIPPSSLMLDELGSLSPAVFLDRDRLSPVVFAAVNMIDLVTIWILILLVIGYGFVARKSLSKGARAACVIGVFLAYAAFRLAFAAFRGI
ncbi:MAG TPA: YIP1 family protein [Terriglobia bacterium]